MPWKSTFVIKVVIAAICLSMLFEVSTLSPRYRYSPVLAQAYIPAVWDILADNFESGRLDTWKRSTPAVPAVINGGGYNGSNGLSVTLSSASSYIYANVFAKAEEGYITFWFNPNGVRIPDQGDILDPRQVSYYCGGCE